ncbi:ABC-2 type transport system permease protein [Oceanicella actignis]|nr:ABC-2 type transport system permease protein [Oceanicella actignis]
MTQPTAPHLQDAPARGGAGRMGARRFGRFNLLGAWTLCMRETLRFANVWTQTLLAPMTTTILFMAVFTVAFAARRGETEGVPFAAFLAPGVAMMAVLQNAFANTSSSLIISKVQGNIVDTLMPPLSPTEILFGYVFGGVARGLAVALLAGGAAFAMAGVAPAHPLWLLGYALAGSAIMALAGVIAGIAADKFDQMAAITNFVVTPLSFLSGTFYSVRDLPPALETASHFNPVFHLIDGFRYGAIGLSDAGAGGAPWTGAAVAAGLTAALWTAAWALLRSGWKLKT